MLSLEKQSELLKSVHHIGVFARLIQIEFENDLVDSKFKQPIINQHAKRIKESAEQIKKALNSPNNPFYVKSQEYMDYEYTLQLYRVFDFFTDMGLEKITEFADGMYKLKLQ